VPGYKDLRSARWKSHALVHCFCGGRLGRARTTYYSPLGVIVGDVPAFECEQCGEIFFDAETSRKLDVLVKSTAKIMEEEEERLTAAFGGHYRI